MHWTCPRSRRFLGVIPLRKNFFWVESSHTLNDWFSVVGALVSKETERLGRFLAVINADFFAKILHIHLLNFSVNDLVEVTCLLTVKDLLARNKFLKLLIDNFLKNNFLWLILLQVLLDFRFVLSVFYDLFEFLFEWAHKFWLSLDINRRDNRMGNLVSGCDDFDWRKQTCTLSVVLSVNFNMVIRMVKRLSILGQRWVQQMKHLVLRVISWRTDAVKLR